MMTLVVARIDGEDSAHHWNGYGGLKVLFCLRVTEILRVKSMTVAVAQCTLFF